MDDISGRQWAELRRSYIAKNDMLFNDTTLQWTYCHAYDFCRAVFGDGFLETRGEQIDWDEPGGGKPNAIAVRITHRRRRVRTEGGTEHEIPVVERYTFCDGFDGIEELCQESMDTLEPVFMAPVSYFGKHRTAANARFLHAFAVDLDGVGTEQLANILKQIRNGSDPDLPKWTSIPQPTFIVNSGTGVHLYYLLDEPVPLVPGNVPFLQELKRRLTDRVWRDTTSTLEERQYQGIYQGFRIPNTTTKLNGRGAGSKRSHPYEAVAFCHYGEDWEPWRCSMEYLLGYLGGTSEKDRLRLDDLARTGGRTPIEQAKERWPEWYRRRLVEGCAPGRWTASRRLYDWWKEQVMAHATDHHRYWCLHSLAAYADKCGVPYDELEADALALVPHLESLTERVDNHFTEEDALAAIAAYGDGQIHRLTRDGISRRTAIGIDPNKRNYRKQHQHMVYLNGLRKMRRDVLGEDEYGNGGRPKGSGEKRDMIRSYAAEHPGASQRAIAKALGVSPTTVNKWLKGAQQPQAEKKA